MGTSLLRSVRTLSLAVALTLLGCGSSSNSRRPDTGYGAGQTPPATINCIDGCQRLGDCGVHLCNEDTMSMRYSGLSGALASNCESTCSDTLIKMKLSTSQWQCIFESSCRQVFDYDVCHEMASYYCH
jgi:hypothetical protein